MYIYIYIYICLCNVDDPGSHQDVCDSSSCTSAVVARAISGPRRQALPCSCTRMGTGCPPYGRKTHNLPHECLASVFLGPNSCHEFRQPSAAARYAAIAAIVDDSVVATLKSSILGASQALRSCGCALAVAKACGKTCAESAWFRSVRLNLNLFIHIYIYIY